jgi:large subunit ribosomal protein L3
MVKAILGKKLNMTQIFDSHGRSVPVTVVHAGQNLITQIKDKEKDGYKAVQIGFGEAKKVNKPQRVSLIKALKKVSFFPAHIREVAFDDDVKVGQLIKAGEVFNKGTMVDVVGISKGKGFAGGVKRWGFHGGPKTHGQSDRHRAPGSIGSGTTPGRVLKGLKMAGHMGVDQITVMGSEVMGIDDETETILIKGSIPGPRGTVVLIKKSNKKRKKYHEPVVQNINLGGDEDEAKEETAEGTESPAEKTDGPTQPAPKQETAQQPVGDDNGNS